MLGGGAPADRDRNRRRSRTFLKGRTFPPEVLPEILMSILLQAAGAALVVLTLADVFLTVLYVRGSAGVFTPALSHGVWGLFRAAARLTGGGAQLLSFSGPVLVSATVALWALALVTGFALVVWPELGHSVRATNGETPTDFVAAFYYSGYAFTTVGIGDLVPKTSTFRLLLVAEGALGFSVISLSLTYFISVYSALASRNTFALHLHHASGGTGDAAEFLARLGAGGELDASARTELSSTGREILSLLQTHHAYSTLHFFRRPAPEYAMARMALVALDTATLARTALDPERHRSTTESASVETLWTGGLRLLDETGRDFLPRRRRPPPEAPRDPVREDAWRRRYRAARGRLETAGLHTLADAAAGEEEYVERRRRWDGQVRAFAGYMDFDWSDIAPHEDAEAA